jgi:hypothetical protein
VEEFIDMLADGDYADDWNKIMERAQEIQKGQTREAQLKIVESWPEWKRHVKITRYSK